MDTLRDNFESSLGYVMGLAKRSLVNRINAALEDAGYDVTCEQGAILMSLWKKNGQSQKELGDCACKDKTSVTRLIDGLEKRGLVLRRAHKSDHRQKMIYLTQRGQKLQGQFLELLYKTMEEAQQGISKSDLNVCKNVLKKVAENLA